VFASSTPGALRKQRARSFCVLPVYPVQKVVVNLPCANRKSCQRVSGHAGAALEATDHAEHHAFPRDPWPRSCLRAPLRPLKPLDHFQPGNPNTFRGPVQNGAHFGVSLQIQNLRRTSARRMSSIRAEMAGGGRRRAQDDLWPGCMAGNNAAPARRGGCRF